MLKTLSIIGLFILFILGIFGAMISAGSFLFISIVSIITLVVVIPHPEMCDHENEEETVIEDMIIYKCNDCGNEYYEYL